MIGFEGRHQWRQDQLFKLRAKPDQREIPLFVNMLSAMPQIFAGLGPH
jgi:hypothetical protein